MLWLNSIPAILFQMLWLYEFPDARPSKDDGSAATETATTPPQVALTIRPESNAFAMMRRTLAIRHVRDDRVVGLIEIVSANKDRPSNVNHFATKVVGALKERIHVLVVDLIPPGTRATKVPTAYVEPIAMGIELPKMPLFLDPDWYINVPLAETYEAAYWGVPQRWREVIEGSEQAG